MREIDEISIMAKVFANTLAFYMAFLEISKMYRPVAANIDIRVVPISKFPKLLSMKKLEKLNLCQFCLVLRQNMTIIYIHL